MIEIGPHRLGDDEIEELLATDHPMVERFRLDKEREEQGRALEFALVIVPRRGVRYRQLRDGRGRRIEPVWRTLDGSERIGQGNRALWLEGQKVVAENQTFFPDQTFNDLGIGSALYVSLERLYRALGVRRVTLLAVDVGVYVWARQAFAFLEPSMARGLMPRLERFLFGHGLPCAADAAALRESWDLANLDLPGQAIEGYRVGKAFMLRGAAAWHGIRRLDDPAQNAVAERSRRETFARLPDKIEGAAPNLRVR